MEGSGTESCDAVYGRHGASLRLATGSPGELGLVEALAEAYAHETPVKVCWRKAGSGVSLELLRKREVDMVLIHAPDAERRAVQAGWAVKRTPIGANAFYIVGPSEDPAGIRAATSAVAAYAAIARARAPFISRGDQSGTHRRELHIWTAAGIKPNGEWYRVSNDFMAASLARAASEQAYFMVDSSTWWATGATGGALEILYRGDPVLVNEYHGLCAPRGTTAGADAAAAFLAFIAGPRGQRIIAEYGVRRYGRALYLPAAPVTD